MVSYSAPAKIILSGEHSVVYTKPAFVTAVEHFLTVTIQEGTSKEYSNEVAKALQYCDEIVKQYLTKNSSIKKFPSFDYTYESDIPEGRGMGSSAAFCVATVAALLDFYSGQEFDKQIINSLAYQCEKHFHGMPSGVDVSASCFGGLIFYRKEFEFLKTISSLNFKIPKNIEENLYLIDSGKPVESTKEMVSYVGKNYNANPKKMDQTLQGIEKITKRMVVSIVKEDISMFKQSIEENNDLLGELGIVSAHTKQFIDELKPYGAGKVTGAGGIQKGSGFILFYADDIEKLTEFLSAKKIEIRKFKQNYTGVIKRYV